MTDLLKHEPWDVAIIGAGPTGLAAAMTLKSLGFERILVLDRETTAGGATRHCGHPPFGLREYKRILSGPAYAKRLVESARSAGIEIALKNTVTGLHPEGRLAIASPDGPAELAARRVLLATGIRETPRSALMVSGARGLGICNTGALQSMFYLKGLIPFRRPLVVGTEIVSFSALSTCRKAGIRPVAMIEENGRPTLRWPLYHTTRLFGVPLLLNTQISDIIGHSRIEAVQVSDNKGSVHEFRCDGVLFTGHFTPESALVRASHLDYDLATGSPLTDRFGRCSDPTYYAAGNVLHPPAGAGPLPSAPLYYCSGNLSNPVKAAGKCWHEGQATASHMARDLSGEAHSPHR